MCGGVLSWDLGHALDESQHLQSRTIQAEETANNPSRDVAIRCC